MVLRDNSHLQRAILHLLHYAGFGAELHFIMETKLSRRVSQALMHHSADDMRVECDVKLFSEWEVLILECAGPSHWS